MSANHSLQKLLDELGRLPGIGPKSAQRIAYYLLEADAEEARRAGATVLGTRRTASGETALVPAAAGIGEAADLDQIMTHLDREGER